MKEQPLAEQLLNKDLENLAYRIYYALNRKGAGLGNASVSIISEAIEEWIKEMAL